MTADEPGQLTQAHPIALLVDAARVARLHLADRLKQTVHVADTLARVTAERPAAAQAVGALIERDRERTETAILALDEALARFTGPASHDYRLVPSDRVKRVTVATMFHPIGFGHADIEAEYIKKTMVREIGDAIAGQLIKFAKYEFEDDPSGARICRTHFDVIVSKEVS